MEVVTIAQDQNVSQALDILMKHKILCAPIVDAEARNAATRRFPKPPHTLFVHAGRLASLPSKVGAEAPTRDRKPLSPWGCTQNFPVGFVDMFDMVRNLQMHCSGNLQISGRIFGNLQMHCCDFEKPLQVCKCTANALEIAAVPHRGQLLAQYKRHTQRASSARLRC